MLLKKEKWKKQDILDFQKYIKTYENSSKREWSTNILQTKLPVLCMKTPDIKNIVKEIYEGNYLSFLDYMIWEYYENTAINGFLISKIKDFSTYKTYLDIYSSKADNWATCDLLKFQVKGQEKEYFSLVKEYIKSDKPFVRRIGMYILFDFINDEKYIDKIYELLNCFYDEEEYYVNMMNAWLLCELFIKQRTKTINFLKNHKLNKFTINKGIQKCRDSYRVTIEDKKMLLKYKIK